MIGWPYDSRSAQVQQEQTRDLERRITTAWDNLMFDLSWCPKKQRNASQSDMKLLKMALGVK